ncbi:MAG TPA: ABC transporter ATP-binding protein [Lactobacillus sp.]|nr:ABC transporter ATP-binding protein [Lactobacillus sp.]
MDVKFQDVSLAYDNSHNILNKISFTIPEGQLTCLLGPSGCGKSTTLNLISGLLAPTAGQIFFGDQDVTKKDALARKVGMVFQNYALYPHMTVLDNICFPMKMAKVKKADRIKRGRELAALVHVETELTKKPSELSGGQQQRVAIARALAKSPSILLLDEPLSNLDARLRVEMREEIKRIQKETGVTTVFVTHDQEEAIHIADQIMVLNDGKIQQFTTPNRLYDQPENLFVAKFIGSPIINTLPFADVRDDFKNVLPAGILTSGYTLAMRAESIVPASDPHEHLTLMPLMATQVQSNRFGRETSLTLNYGDHEIVADGFREQDLGHNGRPMRFAIRPQGIFVFDQTGKRIWPATIETNISPLKPTEVIHA